MSTAGRRLLRRLSMTAAALSLCLLVPGRPPRPGQAARPESHGALLERPRSRAGLASRPPVGRARGAIGPPTPRRQRALATDSLAELPSADGDAGGPTLRAAPALPVEVRTNIPATVWTGSPAETAAAGLLEIQLGSLARRVMRVQRAGGRLLLPLAQWLALAEVRYTSAGGRVTWRQQPSRTVVVIEGDSGTVRLGHERLRADSNDVRIYDSQVYGSIRLLAELFHISAAVDEESATLVFHEVDALPLARRLERARARSILIRGAEPLDPGSVVYGPESMLPALALSYELRGSSRPGEATAYDLAMAGAVLRGTAVVRSLGTVQSRPRLEGSWATVWPRGRWLTQLRLGDGPGTGPRPQGLRGLSLGNAPLNRATVVEDLPFAGTLPPDWSVEAYRAGQLVGFDSVGASGRYSLTLPVGYGENPVDFVAYGPFGEVRTFNRTFRALPSMLPPGTLEYGLSIGGCRFARCAGAGNVDVRYGASPRWTFRGGADGAWGGAGAGRTYPYIGFIGTPTNAVGIEAEGVADLLFRSGLRFEPTTAMRLTVDHITYARSLGSAPSLFLPTGTREQWSVYGELIPPLRVGSTRLQAQVTRTVTSTGVWEQARGGAAIRVDNMLLQPYVRGERLRGAGASSTSTYVGLDATVLPRRGLGPVLGGIWLHGEVEAEQSGALGRAALTMARNLGSGFRVEGGTRWQRETGPPSVTLSVVSQLPTVRSTSTLSAGSVGPAVWDQSIGGSVLWSSGSSAPRFSSEPALDRGAVSGRAFIDLNADGRRQPDEPAAPGTRILVGGVPVTAGPDGAFRLWGVPPWEEVLVSVDTASLASPWWTPGFAVAAVTPRPGLVRELDVPIVVGGVVEGRLEQVAGPIGGLGRPLPVVLTHMESGRKTVVESFSDGSFYVMGLRPGRYTAAVADSVAAASGLRSTDARFRLRPARSAHDPGEVVQGIRILLRPRQE